MASTFYFWLVLRRIRCISTDSAYKKGCIKGIGQMHFALTYPGAAQYCFRSPHLVRSSHTSCQIHAKTGSWNKTRQQMFTG